MRQGFLSQYFDGVAAKVLSQVEANILCSNQHEFNGVKGLKRILGEPDGKVKYTARFLYISDNDEEFTSEDKLLTWYDSRQKARIEHDVIRYEYRLYFPDNVALATAQAGDILVIAKNKDGSLLAIIAAKDTTAAKQLCWMFGFDDKMETMSIRNEDEMDQGRIGLAQRFILEQIGIEIEDETPDSLGLIIEKFGVIFPATTLFSDFVREQMPHVSGLDDPDAALMAWMEKEEIFYRALERHLLVAGLDKLMQQQNMQSLDPEPFIKIVQSTLQRRKSRAGAALENHLEKIFQLNGIKYTRTGITENRLKPDFIFPSIKEYHTPTFSDDCLTMLGAKTTCKDRWRQILNEATRIPKKHLATIEPSISEHQTNEMKLENVQLVVPKALHTSFTEKQQKWLLSIADFTNLVQSRAVS